MPKAPRSKLEAKLDEVLKKIYPLATVLRDYPIRVKNKTLYVDRLIKAIALAFEVDGEQHLRFSKFFHKDSEGFESHKDRDLLKEEWLASNGYALVRIAHDDILTVRSLRKKILEAMNGRSD